MPISPAYQPDPQFDALGPDFADPVTAADFPQTLLRYRNDRAAASVGLAGLTGYLDVVLLPALAFFIGLTIYAIWRKKQFDACCDNGSIKSRNTPPE